MQRRLGTHGIRMRDGLERAEWREPEGVSIAQGGYLQYRLELGATLSLATPRVTKVTIGF